MDVHACTLGCGIFNNPVITIFSWYAKLLFIAPLHNFLTFSVGRVLSVESGVESGFESGVESAVETKD